MIQFALLCLLACCGLGGALDLCPNAAGGPANFTLVVVYQGQAVDMTREALPLPLLALQLNLSSCVTVNATICLNQANQVLATTTTGTTITSTTVATSPTSTLATTTTTPTTTLATITTTTTTTITTTTTATTIPTTATIPTTTTPTTTITTTSTTTPTTTSSQTTTILTTTTQLVFVTQVVQTCIPVALLANTVRQLNLTSFNARVFNSSMSFTIAGSSFATTTTTTTTPTTTATTTTTTTPTTTSSTTQLTTSTVNTSTTTASTATASTATASTTSASTTLATTPTTSTVTTTATTATTTTTTTVTTTTTTVQPPLENFTATFAPLQCPGSLAAPNCAGRLVLDQIRNNTIPVTWWDTSILMCRWPGVSCVAGAITALNLTARLRNSTILPSLGPLTSLQALSLDSNNLTQSVNTLSLASLTSLRTLSLANNLFAETLPSSLFQLPALVNMTLANNNFSGSLPPIRVAATPNFAALDVSLNQLTGPLPSLGPLTSARLLQRASFLYNCPIGIPSTVAVPDMSNASLCTCGLVDALPNVFNSSRIVTNLNQSIIRTCATGFSTRLGTSSFQQYCARGGLMCNETNSSTCQCLLTGCDRIGGSGLVFDVCGRCGGDNRTCAPVFVQAVLVFSGSTLTLDALNNRTDDINRLIANYSNTTANASSQSVVQLSASQFQYTVTYRVFNESVNDLLAVFTTINTTNGAQLIVGLNATGLNATDITGVAASASQVNPSSPSTGSSGSGGSIIIIAAAAGGGGAVLLLLLLCLCCRRKNKAQDGAPAKARKPSKAKRGAKADELALDGGPRNVKATAALFAQAKRTSDLSGQPSSVRSTTNLLGDGETVDDDLLTETDLMEGSFLPASGHAANGMFEFGKFNDSSDADATAAAAAAAASAGPSGQLFYSNVPLSSPARVPLEQEEEEDTLPPPPKSSQAARQVLAIEDLSQSTYDSVDLAPKRTRAASQAPPVPLAEDDVAGNIYQNQETIRRHSINLGALPPPPASAAAAPASAKPAVPKRDLRASFMASKVVPARSAPVRSPSFRPGGIDNVSGVSSGSSAVDAESPKKDDEYFDTAPSASASAAASRPASMISPDHHRESVRRAKLSMVVPVEEEVMVLREPEKWSSIECMMWLKHNGFKEFTDIFYSNGFEGWHLVNLSFDSFAGVRTLTPARITALLEAITALKAAGSWTVPSEKDEAVASAAAESSPLPVSLPTLPAPDSSAAMSPPSIGAVGRLNSAGSSGSHGSGPRSGSFTQARSASSLSGTGPAGARGSVSGYALPDTPDVERARLKYFLTQELSREDSIMLLHNGSGPDGEYLIRQSRRKAGSYVLCVIAAKRVHHFEIFYRDFDQKFCTSNGHKFSTLDALVEHFRSNANDGIPVKLAFCCRHYDRKVKATMDAAAAAASPAPATEEVYQPVDFDDPPAPAPVQEAYEVIVPQKSQLKDFKSMLEKNTNTPALATSGSVGSSISSSNPRRTAYENQPVIDGQERTSSNGKKKAYENQTIIDTQDQPQYMPPSAFKH